MDNLMRDQVFISYAHKDQAWFDEFYKHLAAAEAKNLLNVWSDKEIPPGALWFDGISKALSRARVGLLLVTPEFIASDFIRNEELRALLGAREQGRLSLFWVPISAGLFQVVGLDQLQAAPGCDPARPLDTLPEPERRQVIVNICRRILDEMGRLPSMTRDDRVDLRGRVSERLDDRYELLEEVGTGSSTIVYRARSKAPDRVVAVKTLVTAGLHSDTRRDFMDRLDVAYKLTGPAYIRVYDALFDREPLCVVTEFVEGTCLSRYLESKPLPSAALVGRILRELSRALAEAHALDYLHEGLLPSNVHVDAAGNPRLSAFRFLSIGGSAAGTWGTFLVTHETCTYLSPEQFEGQPRTKGTDQYALGLLGYELLSGQRLERVTRPADFVARPALFDRLARDGEWMRRAPALGGVIARMLRVDPRDRWSSMNEVADLFEDCAAVDEDGVRSRVLASYSRFQPIDRARRLAESFYSRFFGVLPELRALFPATMERQYDMLNGALKLLVDFDATVPASVTALGAVAAKHRGFALREPQIQAFEEALLGALAEVGDGESGTADAWRKALAPGLKYLREAILAPAPAEARPAAAAGGPPASPGPSGPSSDRSPPPSEAHRKTLPWPTPLRH